MSALHFPASTKPAHLSPIGKRSAKGSVPKMTRGAARVWGLLVAPLAAWLALLAVYAVFYGARP